LQKFIFLLTSIVIAAGQVSATTTTYTVTTPGDTTNDPMNGFEGATGSLRYYINQINLTSPALDYVINFDLDTNNTISLADMLPVLNLTETNTLTIDGSNGGNPIVIDGGSSNRAFIAFQGSIALQNMTIQNTLATGGTSAPVSTATNASGGGGGMGAGSAIYVYTANVSLSDITLNNNQAVGGGGGGCTSLNATDLVSGGSGMGGAGAVNGGGGGLGGNGGVGSNALQAGGGGGGGLGITAIGGASASNGKEGEGIGAASGGVGGGNSGGGLGGTGGIYCGGGGGGALGFGVNGGGGGGGGGYGGNGGSASVTTTGGDGGDGTFGGGGGGGGTGTADGAGGIGGYGGGGGGSVNGIGGMGGFGGGGAGGVGMGKAGPGGFGGGGGGGNGGTGGVGGGDGGGPLLQYGGGGGGAGLGGAIFIDTGSSSGTVTFTGPLTITASSVTAGAGGVGSTNTNKGKNGAAAGSDIFVMTQGVVNADLVFSPSAGETVLLNGSIGDDSVLTLPGGPYNAGAATGVGVRLTGAGTLDLEGANTYARRTNVENGKLIVNGSIASTLNVVIGATAEGTGTISGAATIHGTLAPGNSIGTMFFGTSLTLEADSTFDIEVDPAGSSAAVANTATLNSGTLAIDVDPGTYILGTEYTILSASSITGTFGTKNFPPKVVFDVNYSSTNVVITLVQLPILTLNGLSGNSLAVATYLNAVNLPYLSGFTTLALLSDSEQGSGLLTISPSRNSFNTFMMQQNLFTLSDLISSRTINNRAKKHLHEINQKNFSSSKILALGSEDRDSAMEDMWLIGLIERDQNPNVPKEANDSLDEKYNVWLTEFGEVLTQQKQKQNPEFDVFSGGIMFGMDRWSLNNGLMGAGLAFMGSNIHENQNFGSSTIEGLYPTIYASVYSGHLFLDVAIWGGFNWIQNRRNIFYPGFYTTAKGDFVSYELNPHIALGYSFDTEWVTLEPFVAADFANTFDQSYDETDGVPYNMAVPKRHSSMLQGEGGFSAYWSHMYTKSLLTIIGRASYIYRKPLSTGSIRTSIVGYPGSFSVVSFTTTENILSPNLELLWKTRRGYYFSLMYDGQFSLDSQYMSNELAIKLGRLF
jgi:uncharacterized protein with beta-barrel porin domain